MKARLRQALTEALESAQQGGDLPQVTVPIFSIERPKQASHGDLAANLAMQLAKPCRRSPRDVAQALLAHLGDAGGLVEKVEIAGPGFLNFFFSPAAWLSVLPQILEQGPAYGQSDWGAGRKVNVEFVSANPTGPLHVGHGRGAAFGDVLARLLSFCGFKAATEYYINDAGTQMETLGRSVLIRARQIRGSKEPFPEKHYQGEYIKDLAAEFMQSPEGAGLDGLDEAEAVGRAAAWAGLRILDGIKGDLETFGVRIQTWFSESSLVGNQAVDKAFAELEKRGHLYEQDGALWFRATSFGDEKDRVIKRSNGEITYFASDIAYHLDKFQRGFNRLIDVWGADHHGYIPRMKAAAAALDHSPDDLDLVLVQLVNLLRGGEPVAMSTRGGEFVTLKEVVDEVGRDSARFIFLTRRAEAPLDFDLEVAKQKSLDNPVYYVQYAHTRVRSILRKAETEGVPLPDPGETDLSPLSLAEEMAMVRRLDEYPEVIEGAAKALEPHRLTYFLQELAGAFHSYYNAHRVLVDEPSLAAARLVLVQAVGQVLSGGLGLLGVEAPEVM
ncbi:MAG: arginine--tRNA ligase [Desulfarculaceae bacterium]|jgi:arginyl-tRNA synthetase